MSVFRQLKNFFEPEFVSYDIKSSKQKVLDQLIDGFYTNENKENHNGLLGDMDGESFIMGTIAADNSAMFSASIKGRVTERQSGYSKIEIYIMRNSSAYLTFYLSIIAAFMYLVMYFFNTDVKGYLTWSLGTLIIGSVFSIWISNHSSKTVRKQFELFLEENNLLVLNQSLQII